MTKRPWLVVATVLATLATACGEDLENSGSSGGGGSRSVVVGSANFPENALLAELYAGALEADGVEVSKKLNIGSREVLFPALEKGEISLLPEYTGALLDYVRKGESADATATEEQVTELRAALPAKLALLEPSEAQDQETITCRRPVVDEHGLRSIADLAPVSKDLVFGGPPELPGREGFGLKGLKRLYDVEFKSFRPLDVAGPLTVSALKSGKVDCANLFSTQSAISVNGFVSLDDPKGLIASQAVVPLMTKSAATPETTATLDRVSAKLTTDELEQMVKRVEIDKEDAADVAQDFLREKGLVD